VFENDAQPSVSDILSGTPEGAAWLRQQPDISFDDLIKLYPEARSFLKTSENVDKAKKDGAVRKKLVVVAQELRFFNARNVHQFCDGRWIRIFTSCFSFKLGLMGLPEWLVYSIIALTWILLLSLSAFVAWKLFRPAAKLLHPHTRRARFFIVGIFLWVAALLVSKAFAFDDVLNWTDEDGIRFFLWMGVPILALLADRLVRWAMSGSISPP
jgi:hypothetical protein